MANVGITVLTRHGAALLAAKIDQPELKLNGP
jgi:hypothetical protein